MPPHVQPGRPAAPAVRAAARLLLALQLVAGTWLALTPRPPPAVDTGWDKANHLLAFAVLALTAAVAFREARRRDAACAAALLVYGAAVELAQAVVPQRSAEWLDWLADALGIAAGLLLARLVLR